MKFVQNDDLYVYGTLSKLVRKKVSYSKKDWPSQWEGWAKNDLGDSTCKEECTDAVDAFFIEKGGVTAIMNEVLRHELHSITDLSSSFQISYSIEQPSSCRSTYHMGGWVPGINHQEA